MRIDPVNLRMAKWACKAFSLKKNVVKVVLTKVVSKRFLNGFKTEKNRFKTGLEPIKKRRGICGKITSSGDLSGPKTLFKRF